MITGRARWGARPFDPAGQALAGRAGTGFVAHVSVPPQPAPGPVLLYDSGCGLCNRVVRFLLRLDRTERLRFSALQGPSGQAYLKAAGLPLGDFSSVVFVPDWAQRDRPQFLLRTDGVLAALRVCGGLGRFLGAVAAIAPIRCSDGVYKFVARLRYRVFGPWRPVPLPDPDWAKRFID